MKPSRMFAALICFTLVAAEPNQEACAGPTSDVLLWAIQDPDRPEAFALLVKNRTPSNLVSISVGIGSKDELARTPLTIPQSITAPSGWEALTVSVEETPFIRWVWSAPKPSISVGPGEFRGGFGILLPSNGSRYVGQVQSDGGIVRPVNVVGLPFRAYFFNGACKWGKIRAGRAE